MEFGCAGDHVIPLLAALSMPAANCDRVLVIIQMNGGNDGLNMVIPLDRYGAHPMPGPVS